MWNLQLNDSYLSRAHNFLFSELFHMYNLIWAHSPAPNPEMCMSFINLWNQISHKGQVFLDRKPPDCKLHRNDNTNVQMHGHRGKEKKKCLYHSTKIPPGPPHSFARSASQLTCVCWGLPRPQSGLTKHPPNPGSGWASAAGCLRDPMLGDLHGNKEQLTCFTTRHEEKKLHSGASWDFSSFLCVVGWRPIFFLTRERAACFPVRACVSDSTLLFSSVLLLLYG